MKASNVLLTKSRAMYGKRLTGQNVSDLLGCQTVTEVAAYLKNNTHYAYALRNIDDSNVHRGQLEAALDELMQRELTALSKYRVDAGEYMRSFMVYNTQIREILKFLRLMSAGRAGEYVFAMPKYFVKRDGLDPIKMAGAKNYDEFLRAMSGTVFYKILRGISVGEDGTIDYTMIEHALYSHLFSYAESVIRKNFHGAAKEDLLGLLGTRSESGYIPLRDLLRQGAGRNRRGIYRSGGKSVELQARASSYEVLHRPDSGGVLVYPAFGHRAQGYSHNYRGSQVQGFT